MKRYTIKINFEKDGKPITRCVPACEDSCDAVLKIANALVSGYCEVNDWEFKSLEVWLGEEKQTCQG